MHNRSIGRVGEAEALRYLEQQGYRLVERNFYTRFSELDLICRQGGTLVFVEVKARTSHAFGTPEEAITPGKIRRLRQGIALYLAERQPRYSRIQLDAVAVDLAPGSLAVRDVRHYPNIG
ncbi:MAG: YraN family protein [Bacillota bacterium]|jgi:putative endonuclease